ncbi:MAG TPA: beta-xylosidase [Rariglobus sp.]
MKNHLLAPLAGLLCAGRLLASDPVPATTTHEPAAPFPVAIQVDAAKPVGPMKPIWRFFGADEPNYATMKDGKKLIGQIGELRPKDTFFRAHNLLCTGDGTAALKWGSTNAYTEDAQGNPVYNWKILDEIFDTYLQRGVRPYAQIGFMPKALSIKPEPYQHHWKPGLKYSDIITGWAYPPKDYDKWRELVYQWVKHCVERYGRAEVETWYWEVWNEPNGSYWKASKEEFQKLHDYAVDGVRRALPTARVGGPDVAGSGGKFMESFLDHLVNGTNYATGAKGTPTDFLAFHAKGAPTFVDGHVRMGIANQLRVIDDGFRMIAAIPELKDKPIVIGESDPDGCAACQGPQLGYRNTTMYSSYTAASFARKYQLMDKRGVNLDGALTWAFEFENEPWFAGFRVLATNGITLPVFNVFRMFSQMGGQRVATTSSSEIPLAEIMKAGVRQKPDVAALASVEPRKLAILVWHYHDDDVPGPAADVELAIAHLPAAAAKDKVRVTRYLIDETHGNSFTAWKKLGSPTTPTPAQYAELEAAGALAQTTAPKLTRDADGTAKVSFPLTRQAVSLLVLEW